MADDLTATILWAILVGTLAAVIVAIFTRSRP